MSLPAFSTQSELFSTAGLSRSLFEPTDRYRPFAKLVYPCLAQVRSELAGCYCEENGRSAVEPVLMRRAPRKRGVRPLPPVPYTASSPGC